MRLGAAASVLLSLLATPAWCGSTLTTEQEKVLSSWLAQHSNYRLATDADCDCADDIKQMREGYGDASAAVRDYHPYVATGDFNGDRVEDFAVALIDGKAQAGTFTLVVFNGPLSNRPSEPAFVKPDLQLLQEHLFYFGPPRPKPYRLFVGRFESDFGFTLEPSRRTYRIQDSDQ